MELKDTKCNSCKALRKQNDFIYNEKINKSCCFCRDKRLKFKQYTNEYNKNNKEKRKEYNENNKDKIKEKAKVYTKEYRENNKDKIKEYMNEYRDNNKDKITKKMKEYYDKKKDNINEQKKEQYQNQKKHNPLHLKILNMITNSVASDTKKNRTYDENDYIDYDFLYNLWEKQEGKCGYECCKCEMVLTFNKDTRNPYQVSVQRLNNDIAHIKSNVILSCFMCNVIKHREHELL